MCINTPIDWSGLSCSKYKDGIRQGDDFSLIIPGRFAAIFDGATGQQLAGGRTGGQIASSAAANALMQFDSSELMTIDADKLINHLSQAVGEAQAKFGLENPISSTASIVVCSRNELRAIILGDTGVRINGGEVYAQDIGPDLITIPARIAFFQFALEQSRDIEEAEALAREVSVRGYHWALKEGVLQQPQAQAMIDKIANDIQGAAPSDLVAEILSNGLQNQYSYANNLASPLGYGVLNGDAQTLAPLDLRFPMREINSVEIFSDGYQICPDQVSLQAWEAAYLDLEKADPHRLSHAPAIKGSTSEYFHDDRSVIILSFHLIGMQTNK